MIECMRYENETVADVIVEVQKWLFAAKLGTVRLARIKQNYFYFDKNKILEKKKGKIQRENQKIQLVMMKVKRIKMKVINNKQKNVNSQTEIRANKKNTAIVLSEAKNILKYAWKN